MEGISLFIVKVNQLFRAAQIYTFHPYSAQNILNLESKWKKSNFTHGTTIGHKSTISPKQKVKCIMFWIDSHNIILKLIGNVLFHSRALLNRHLYNKQFPLFKAFSHQTISLVKFSLFCRNKFQKMMIWCLNGFSRTTYISCEHQKLS